MDSFSLRHRITLQEEQTTRDNYQAEVKQWVDVATIWAAVEPLKGREYFQAQQVNAETSHRVTIRYRMGVTTAMRVKFGSRTFDIEAVIDPEERHRELQLMCVERGDSDAGQAGS